MRWRPIGLTAATVLGLSLLAPVTAVSTPPQLLMSGGGQYARDCTTLPFLDRDRPRTIRYLIWCGVQSGKVRFSVRRNEAAKVLDFPRQIAVAGSGANGAFHCRRVVETIKCAGRIDGPSVLRGSISVPGSRCIPVSVSMAGGEWALAPRGCPGTHPSRPPRLSEIRRFRRIYGLDIDLRGQPRALQRRLRDLVRAWKRGAPVARAMAAVFTVPMRPRDQRELEYRSEYYERDSTAIERWGSRHAPSTYAGWELDDEEGGIFYIGFIGDQEAQLAAFENQVRVLAPDRIRPFPDPPEFSKRQLEALEEDLYRAWSGSKKFADVNQIWIDVLANRVTVGTEHVAKVKKLLTRRFGADAPFVVVFQEPLELL